MPNYKSPKSNESLPSGLPSNWPNPSKADLENLPNRVINVGFDDASAKKQIYSFESNRIKTSKYEFWSFIPLFLMEEFNPKQKVAMAFVNVFI